jgi:hypothetical protein
MRDYNSEKQEASKRVASSTRPPVTCYAQSSDRAERGW